MADSKSITIPLTKGYVTIVDLIDAELAQFNWCVSGLSNYAARKVGGRRNSKMVYMHRAIMERAVGRSLESNEHIDHANGDVRDNRRSNLRIATYTENGRNQRRNKANTSGFKGVTFVKRNHSRPWRAYIVVDDRQIHLGSYETADDAAEAYRFAARLLFGEFARFE